jgi:carboxypeptidase Taq
MIDPLFNELKSRLPAMIDAIVSTLPERQAFEGDFPVEKQAQLGQKLMKLLGFNFSKGRLDVSHHPFCGGVSDDVRITTRYQTHEFISSVMGVCHETGHALYEFGLPKSYRGQPVGDSYGMTIHESQSLFMEMQICRSPAFMTLLSQNLTEVFGPQTAFNPDNLHKHYLHVNKGLIRVDADELTYPLHVIMRYEMEKKLISGKLNVNDLPEVWHQYMHDFLGLSTQGNHKDGVMQDVHWPCGALGYFPAYTLGALVAAQLAQKMRQDLPVVMNDLSKGNLLQVGQWLTENIHQHGSFYSLEELMKRTTGKKLGVEAYFEHITQRYG